MAVRNFGSPDGNTWNVWAVVPDQVADLRSPFGTHLPARMAEGWLCFDCGSEKRRLYPPPADWAQRTEAELWFLCRAAEPVRARAAAGYDAAPLGQAPAALSEAREPAGV